MKSLGFMRPYGLVALVLVGGSLPGCGKAKQPWEKVVPASGVIVYNGKPLAGAQILLIPEDEKFPSSVRPSATSGDDGTFQIGTYSHKDGAPEGGYKAVVLHYPVVGPKENPTVGANDLPAKYAKPTTTDLRVEITAKNSDVLELTLKK
ncbi:hypothetical protein [Schlesneria paludicola]|uniref:hypothetical protein n=1 Tax=Schlesneria paludicola TaxID=360056 RepID=UPI00029A74D6|nr:hypothetical protein [Schlesneria paludicola]